MKCQECKKEFDTPLERFDGKLFCPLCGKSCRIDIELEVTDKSDEQYRMGELFYLKSLVCTDAKQRNAYKERSRELVSAAALSGHPKALLRLGYMYYSGFMTGDRKIAVSLAANYFRNVWEGKYADNLAEYEGLKRIAAAHHLEMLKSRGNFSQADKVKEQMKSAGVNLENIAEQTFEEEIGDPKTNLTNALKSCSVKSASPIFGVISISGAEFKQWAKALVDVKVKGVNVSNIKYFMEQKILLQYIYLDEDTNGYDIFGIDQSMLQKLENGVAEIDDSEELYIYFFNQGNCPKKYKTLEKYLDDDDASRLKQIVSGICTEQRDIIIREDDILLYRDRLGESIKHAFDDLIRSISSKTYLHDTD